MSSNSRSRSPQPSRQRPSKDQKVAHLSNLPRFHPAVYQSPSTTTHTSQTNASSSTTSMPQRPSHPYRVPSASRDALRQYRELVASVALTPRSNPSTIYTKPSTPQLDPLGSPGPVTPLALEDSDNYFAAGEMQGSSGTPFLSEGSGPSAELVEKLIQRESERLASQQGGRIETKAR
ncbi:hypothetical protein FQN54_007879 [Arachnomyces sp. PD_36]|nr:hypothetical protein FQN54_007879 [Arachnomyces sp. PD_36]